MIKPRGARSRWGAVFVGVSFAFVAMSAPAVAAGEPPPAKGPIKSPLSPADSLRHFHLAPGLRIELVAAEPEIIDPVSVAFDEDNRLWAVEMTDYPNGPPPGEPPRCRIRVLEDRDQDGYYETARVFADKLLFATGVQPWRGGVIVTLAGEIAWFKDTDGDGRADVRETWFRGFAQENSQLRANHPRLALDNRIYVANGLKGGKIVADAAKWMRSSPEIALAGMDFSFDPLSGEHGTVAGNGQFGLTFDDFGNRFICSNRNPCRQVVLEDRYVRRNPSLAVRDIAADVSPPAADSHVYPLSRAWTTSTQHAGQFTAACGVTIYRGDALPPAYRGNAFICEPTGNLVHRDVLQPRGATFAAAPSTATEEFLASADEWFRPVDLATGPDGALYVVDMYRAVIEHPEWVPEELKRRPDQDFGNDLGRIYRIVPKQNPPPRKPVALSSAPIATLVEMLSDANGWRRDTAARLILERQDLGAIEPLRALAASGSASPVARIHALRALDGLQKLSAEIVLAALADASPRVQEEAARLSERWARDSREFGEKLIALSGSTDARLRFQVALSLGELPPSDESRAALAAIAVRDAADEWTRRAVLSSVGGEAVPLFTAVLDRGKPGADLRLIVREIAELIGSRQQQSEIHGVLARLAALRNGGAAKAKADETLTVSFAALGGLGQGLARRGERLAEVIAMLPDTERAHISAILTAAAECAGDRALPAAERLVGLSLLQYASFEATGDTLFRIAEGDPEQELRVQAIDVLGAHRDPQIGRRLLAAYPALTPAVRRGVLQALMRDPARIRLLLEELAAGRVALAEIDPVRARELVQHPDPETRRQAAALFEAAVPAERQQVLKDYQPALELVADPRRGRLVFEKNCITCHQIGDLGVDVAPNIADSRTKTPAMLLTDILHPNQAIDSNYVSYTVVTLAGKTYTGVIAAETASSITLRQPENKTEIVLRQEIDEMRSNGISLMPEGLEKNISRQEMADLIRFIKRWRYLDGQVPVDAN